MEIVSYVKIEQDKGMETDAHMTHFILGNDFSSSSHLHILRYEFRTYTIAFLV